MKIAIYPGSFDPITKGHIDVIERSSKIFDEIIVVLMKNDKKTSLFNDEERLDMMEEACATMGNVTCDIGSGLSTAYARKKGACVMIRGIRAVQDYEYELTTATANMYLNSDIETCFFMSKPEFSFLSSSTVKEIAGYGASVDGFVSPYVVKKLKEKLKY